MAKTLIGDLGMDTRSRQVSGMGVAQIVKASDRQSRLAGLNPRAATVPRHGFWTRAYPPAWLAASRFARVQGPAFCPLKKTSRPAPPALGHSGNRKQPIGFMAITGVDAEYMSNGEIMIGSLDDPDLISGPHITFDDDSQISPGSRRLGEAARKQLIIHPNS